MIRYVTIGFYFAGMNKDYFTRFRAMIATFSISASSSREPDSARKNLSSFLLYNFKNG